MIGVETRFDVLQSNPVKSVHHPPHLDLFACKQWNTVHIDVTLRSVRATIVVAGNTKKLFHILSKCL